MRSARELIRPILDKRSSLRFFHPTVQKHVPCYGPAHFGQEPYALNEDFREGVEAGSRTNTNKVLDASLERVTLKLNEALNQLAKDELSLCSARTLILRMCEHVSNQGLSFEPALSKEIKEHIEAHETHRLADRQQLIKMVRNQLGGLDAELEKVEQSLISSSFKEYQRDARRLQIEGKIAALKIKLETLEKFDPLSVEFLDSRSDREDAKSLSIKP